MYLSLHRAMLTYGGGVLLHTASSGRILGLDSLYLHLAGDGFEATGEARINIAYLNGLDAESLVSEAVDLAPNLSLGADPLAALADPPLLLLQASAPLRMLVDIALHDLAAQRAGLPLAAYLAGTDLKTIVRYPTNQSLFLSNEAIFLRQAEAYVKRGFKALKVRIGNPDFAQDLGRLRCLRDRFGAEIELAADVNGRWSLDAARCHLEALARLDLCYVEQPTLPAPLEVLARLAEDSPIPIMLDESVDSERAVTELAAGGHRLMVHLKLVKLGGIGPVLRAANALKAAGVALMIGQMNEGGIATAAALHLASALQPPFAELYGADGLDRDAAPGLAYLDGCVSAPQGAGLGLSFDARRTQILWEGTR